MRFWKTLALAAAITLGACGGGSSGSNGNGNGNGGGDNNSNIPADAGSTSNNGCTDKCGAGAKACEGAGFKTCETKADGCRDWSAVTACASNEICDSGACRKNCTDNCAENAKACEGAGFKVCETKANGCRDWSTVTACAANEICDTGACRKNCTDTCAKDSKICDNAGVRTCTLGTNGCFDWSTAAACGSGQVCSAGICVNTCQNQCTAGDTVCSGTGFLTCVKLSTGCTDWTSPTACTAGQTCSAGKCGSGACTNACTENATRCTANGQLQTCTKLASGCTDWALPTACATGQICPNSGDHCVAKPCAVGDTRCNGTQVETCDAVGSWYVTQACPQACSNGKCTASAACTPGAVRCNANNVEICNSSGTAWLYNQTCNVGCANGQCSDPCTSGAKRCNGKTPETCNSTGTGWTAGQVCLTDCYKGACIDADLVVDGITKTIEGEQVFQNGVVVKNGGQLKVGATGKLILRAKTVSIDSSSSIVASGIGDETRGSPPVASGQQCCNAYWSYSSACSYVGNYRQACQTSSAPASYGVKAASPSQCIGGCPSSNCCTVTYTPGNTYDSDTDTSISEGSKAGTDLGGGMVAIYAEQVDVAGQITANGNATASGGGVLIAAEKITSNGPIQTAGGSGSPAGGDGRVKLLHGGNMAYAGTVQGRKTVSVMPPLAVVSGSHPDQSRWYNDGLGDLFLAWAKPFSTLNGYYWLFNTNAADVPSPSNGTFLQAESLVVQAAKLKQGQNYFHISSVDSGFNVGTVEQSFLVNLNTVPPSISSTSHANQRTWYQNNAIFLSWTNPQDDANFTGYYYVFDHYADTVPTSTAGTFTTNPKLLLSNVTDGIWVFHLVNRDTRGATTKAAAHFTVYVGTEPMKGNLSGSAFDGTNNNAPLTGVTISINRGLFSTTTQSNGTYTFGNNLYEGTWEVTASKAGYQSQTKTVTVAAGMTVNQNFTLTK